MSGWVREMSFLSREIATLTKEIAASALEIANLDQEMGNLLWRRRRFARSPSGRRPSRHFVEKQTPIRRRTPPPVEMSPPPVEMQPPVRRRTPPPVETSPPPVETSPPSVEMSPPPVEMSPATVEMSPATVRVWLNSGAYQYPSFTVAGVPSASPAGQRPSRACEIAALLTGEDSSEPRLQVPDDRGLRISEADKIDYRNPSKR
jgi:hypothetical protein